MAKRSKAYVAAAQKITEGKFYTPAEAVTLVKETGTSKFDATVEVAVKLGVDPRKADQMIRGTVGLPHGTGKTARVIVFATGAAADAAREAGADEVGGDELIEKVAAGWTDFDSAVSTPELMGKVGRLGKVLGPRNLMLLLTSRVERLSSALTSSQTFTSSLERSLSLRNSLART